MDDGDNKSDRYIEAIRQRKLSIYDSIESHDPDLWIPSPELEYILRRELTGVSVERFKIRTRSKVVKEHICRALGYPVPSKFKKTQPRFPGQTFDTYVQKSRNLQIWNEDIVLGRRYVIVHVDELDFIDNVKVVTGSDLARLDTTGTLTQKYQATLRLSDKATELIDDYDTDLLQSVLSSSVTLPTGNSPIDAPELGSLFSIEQIFDRLAPLVGVSFQDEGADQERNRGAALHRLVCSELGYSNYEDDGQFPDIRNQLLEVKLQTSPTIDLGMMRPDSQDVIEVLNSGQTHVRVCDVRYAVYNAISTESQLRLTHFILSTGSSFFNRFPQFQGNQVNRKIQIPLPANFFD